MSVITYLHSHHLQYKMLNLVIKANYTLVKVNSLPIYALLKLIYSLKKATFFLMLGMTKQHAQHLKLWNQMLEKFMEHGDLLVRLLLQ